MEPLDIQAIAFDVNGTLIDILTDDAMEEIYRSIRHYLTYQGIDLARGQVRDLYFHHMKEQMYSSAEKYPEYDAIKIWQRIVSDHQSDFTRALPAEKQRQLPLFLAELHRGISRKRLELYPFMFDVLQKLRMKYPLAIVTDAQSVFARAELHKVGIVDMFHPIIISGDYGYRKPDARLFRAATTALAVPPERTLYVGNDMYRDIYGARQIGMKTVLYMSEFGDKTYDGTAADYTISDYRELLKIVGIVD